MRHDEARDPSAQRRAFFVGAPEVDSGEDPRLDDFIDALIDGRPMAREPRIRRTRRNERHPGVIVEQQCQYGRDRAAVRRVARRHLALFYRVWLGQIEYDAATRCGSIVVDGPRRRWRSGSPAG
jgi:hypothetical protein